MKDTNSKSYMINRLAILSDANEKLEKAIDLMADRMCDCPYPEKQGVSLDCHEDGGYCAECTKLWALRSVGFEIDEKNDKKMEVL